MPISATASSAVAPRAISSPAWRLRPWRLQQVTIRSPIPARPANVSGRAPHASPRRAISASPRVISAALRVVAEAEAVDAAGGERDHVLRRRAELDAGHVGVHVDAEDRRVDRVLELGGERLVVARDHGRARQAVGDLLGHVRPGEDGDRPVADERREPLAGRRVEALRQRERGTARAGARPRPRRRRGSARRARRGRRRPGVACAAVTSRRSTARQVARVAPGLGDRRACRVAAGERDVVAAVASRRGRAATTRRRRVPRDVQRASAFAERGLSRHDPRARALRADRSARHAQGHLLSRSRSRREPPRARSGRAAGSRPSSRSRA